jgi:thioredoxin-like negative regulator of GroEL
MGVVENALLVLGGGGATVVAQWGLAWLKGRSEIHRANRDTDAKLEEHRDSLTFDLLSAAREEIAQWRAQAAQLGPMMVHAAHLEEALDHLHALLHSESDLERQAAEKRAAAFLRRMRPQIGDLRQAEQRKQSFETLSGSTEHNGTDVEGRLARRVPPSKGKGR